MDRRELANHILWLDMEITSKQLARVTPIVMDSKIMTLLLTAHIIDISWESLRSRNT